MGDPFFDLGNFSINHELTPDEDAILLAAYDGEVHPGAPRADHADARRVATSARRCGASSSRAISTLDVDFVAYADEHFDRLLVACGSPAFERALREAVDDSAPRPLSGRGLSAGR